ncbi:DUF4232 domain-containing protein [Streptomyces sp. M19]
MSRSTALRRTRSVAAAALIAAAAFAHRLRQRLGRQEGRGPAASAGADGSGIGQSGNSPTPRVVRTGPRAVPAARRLRRHGDGRHGAERPDSASSESRCATDNLSVAWSDFEGGPDMDYDGQQTARVVLTNTGTTDCTMVGFPGVQLQAADGATWDLQRTGDEPESVRVDAGSQASFDITLQASTGGDDQGFEPSQVVITPPNETTQLTLDWPYGGALLDQSGATHPGTYIGPVNAGER